jgi:hypothetical protein
MQWHESVLLLTYIAPAAWKHRVGIGSDDKRDAIARAIERRPDAAPLLRGTQDYGRAAALLIAIVGGRCITTPLA